MKFKPLRTLFTSLKKETFHIPDGNFVKLYLLDDCIKSISGHVSSEINQIGFETYKGHKATYGIEKGTSFNYHFPQHTFSIAKGLYDKYLRFLSLKVIPVNIILTQCKHNRYLQ